MNKEMEAEESGEGEGLEIDGMLSPSSAHRWRRARERQVYFLTFSLPISLHTQTPSHHIHTQNVICMRTGLCLVHCHIPTPDILQGTYQVLS